MEAYGPADALVPLPGLSSIASCHSETCQKSSGRDDDATSQQNGEVTVRPKV